MVSTLKSFKSPNHSYCKAYPNYQIKLNLVTSDLKVSCLELSTPKDYKTESAVINKVPTNILKISLWGSL